MSEHAKIFCEFGVEVVPPVKPLWERTVPYGYMDEGVRQFVPWGDCLVCLFQSATIILNPRNGNIEGGSDIQPEEQGSTPKEIKDLVIGEGGRAYAWARLGETQIAEGCSGDPGQTEDWAQAQGYPKADWAVIEFDLRSGRLISVISAPGLSFQSSREIGRHGMFLKSDDGLYFDWRTGDWLKLLPAGAALSDAPWRTQEGFAMERMRTGWHRISRAGNPDRFVKLPCDTFGVHEGSGILVGGLSRRRLIAWRCQDLVVRSA